MGRIIKIFSVVIVVCEAFLPFPFSFVDLKIVDKLCFHLGRNDSADSKTGTPLYGGKVDDKGKFSETVVVRAGVFDDLEMLEKKPELEIYTKARAGWVEPIEGAAQFEGMPPA